MGPQEVFQPLLLFQVCVKGAVVVPGVFPKSQPWRCHGLPGQLWPAVEAQVRGEGWGPRGHFTLTGSVGSCVTLW